MSSSLTLMVTEKRTIAGSSQILALSRTSDDTVIEGQGYPGQNVRLARIETSGRYDYSAVEEKNDALRVWLNDCSKVIGTASRAIAGACAVVRCRPGQRQNLLLLLRL
nr:hypothetical protein CFP56_01037 [Quercus suber]